MRAFASSFALGFLSFACSSPNGSQDGVPANSADEAGAPMQDAGQTPGGITVGSEDLDTGGETEKAMAPPPPWALPEGFTEGSFGGYRLLGPVDAVPEPTEGCGYEIRGVVRDFKASHEVHDPNTPGWFGAPREGGHPDFETFGGEGEPGIVESLLGMDKKPVYVDMPHATTTSKAAFDQWYRDTEGVNQAYVVALSLQPNGEKNTFESRAFFPFDDAGFGNEGFPHNFHFTTEFHTEFVYNGGETFKFIGDDDLWVFVNGQLLIDLGGVHPELEAEVRMDDFAAGLGLVPGETYPLDLFHAERAYSQSNFRIDSTLQFTNCGVIIR